MASPYAKTVGGKLKLKVPLGSGAPASGPSVAGVKRPRPDEPRAPVPTAAVAAAAAAAAPAVPARRVEGSGRLVSSGTTLHGVETKFQAELAVGDAIQVANPVSGKDEVRVVRMVLSDKSAGINSPFSTDLVTGTPYHVLKLPKAAADPVALAAEAEKRAADAERAAFGTYASAGGKVTYLEKTGGVFKGYKKVTVDAGPVPPTREELLLMRTKHKSDKFC